MIALCKTSAEINDLYVEQLADGWDWPVGKAESLEAFINLKNNKRISYWVLYKNQPAGVVSFSEHKDYSKTQIGYFIHPDYRKQGILETIIDSGIALFRDLNVELIASVDVNNGRSIKALERVTSVEPVQRFEFSRNRYALVFVLTEDSKETKQQSEDIINVLKSDDCFLKSLKR